MNDRHLYKETEIGHLVLHPGVKVNLPSGSEIIHISFLPGSDAVSIIYRT